MISGKFKYHISDIYIYLGLKDKERKGGKKEEWKESWEGEKRRRGRGEVGGRRTEERKRDKGKGLSSLFFLIQLKYKRILNIQGNH